MEGLECLKSNLVKAPPILRQPSSYIKYCRLENYSSIQTNNKSQKLTGWISDIDSALSPVFLSFSWRLCSLSSVCFTLAFSRLRVTWTTIYKKKENQVNDKQPVIQTLPDSDLRYSGYDIPIVMNSVTIVHTTRVPSFILADTSSL